MKSRVVFLGVLTIMLGSGQLRAQEASTNAATATNSASAANLRENPMISFLTPAQQDEYAAAHAKALTDNPALKLEGEKLMQEYSSVMTSGNAAEKQGVHEKVVQHRQKLRQAMLKEDPKLASVFTEIDNHFSELKAKAAAPPSH